MPPGDIFYRMSAVWCSMLNNGTCMAVTSSSAVLSLGGWGHACNWRRHPLSLDLWVQHFTSLTEDVCPWTAHKNVFQHNYFFLASLLDINISSGKSVSYKVEIRLIWKWHKPKLNGLTCFGTAPSTKCGLGWHSRYCYLLQAGWILVGERFFHTHPDWPWGSPSLLYNEYRVFPTSKADWARLWLLTNF